MEKFKEIKDEILRRGYEAKACEDIKLAEESESMEELAQVIKDNFDWCVFKRVLDSEIIGKYRKEFASVSIYANESCGDGYVVIDSYVDDIFDNATAILYGNATVTRVYGNANIIEVSDNATIKYVSGNATVKYVHNNATINRVYDNATIIDVRGNATINEVFSSATIKEACNNATIKHVFGNATVNNVSDYATVEGVSDSAYISTYIYIDCKIRDHAIMRVRSENKIYTNTEVERPNNN